MKLTVRIITIVIFLAIVAACVSNDDPVWFFFDEPAVITYDDGSTILNTSFGPYSAPELDGDELDKGQCLISNFILDYANTPLIASAISYFKVNDSPLQVQSGAMTNDFTDSILSARILSHYVDKKLFFSFEAYNANAKYQYELVYNTDSVKMGKNEKPVYGMYIRAKTVSDVNRSATKVQKYYYYAFDVSEFAHTYQNDSLYINFYYYAKTKGEQEIYTAFKENPVRFKFSVCQKSD